ncbi:hypothetical protein [Mesorhizobium temperatum]|uniref:Uncharacterized protein n=1 Tax=Mesorhizobium temperatum TaxID=241416 RepID=A0A271L9V2_9HYPH|nr:hypothetical protein [Mesorhizobium temperatum]PAQ04889.1 hypothetical protein CIT26_31965 [Mesorhizobium temperatum]
MPTSKDIEKIATRFANQYNIDLQAIRKDTSTLQALVAAPSIDSKAITESCYTYTGSGADVPNLEGPNSTQVSIDSRLSSRLVEVNLDEASKYAQTCGQLRDQYGALAKQRNDTRYKGEEFVRLDEVHSLEIDAGLYKLPWQEAADEGAGLDAAIQQTEIQTSIPGDMLSAPKGAKKYGGILTDPIVNQNVEANTFITKNTANSSKEQVGTSALFSWNYRSSIELATWLQAQALAHSTLSQLTAKSTTVRRREEFLRKDEGFKLQRASISRNLAWRQIAEHCRPGSPLNYDERLRAIKAQYEVVLDLLVERARVLSTGAKESYGIDLPLPDLPAGSVLDNLSVWLVKLGDALAKVKRTQSLAVLQVLVEVPKPPGPAGGSLDVAVTVDASTLHGQGLLLRGINFEYQGSSGTPLSLAVIPPAAARVLGGSDPLRFGRVCLVAPGLDIRPQFSDQLWNGTPFGEWKINGKVPSVGIDSLIMYLWAIT